MMEEQHTGHIQQHYMETLAEFQVILTTVNCTLLLGKHFLLSTVDSRPKKQLPRIQTQALTIQLLGYQQEFS